DSAMCPSVFLPTSPYPSASGSSPIPTLSSTIQKILSNSLIFRPLKPFSAELYHTPFFAIAIPISRSGRAKLVPSAGRSKIPTLSERRPLLHAVGFQPALPVLARALAVVQCIQPL